MSRQCLILHIHGKSQQLGVGERRMVSGCTRTTRGDGVPESPTGSPCLHHAIAAYSLTTGTATRRARVTKCLPGLC